MTKISLIKTYQEYSDNKDVTASARFYLKMYLTKMLFNENTYTTHLIDAPPNLPTPDHIRTYSNVDAVVLCFAENNENKENLMAVKNDNQNYSVAISNLIRGTRRP
ncbi:hypothetical protein TNCV_3345201 [Trichonephila clavipes]|nr:hypothetical protein TNCV_3345201 [Trichonephila clavipes]